MMSLMPTSFPKKTLKQKEIYSVTGQKKIARVALFNWMCPKRNFSSNK